MSENSATDWEEQDIGQSMRLLSGFPFPSKYFSNDEGFPLVRIRDIISSSIETYYRGPYQPSYIVHEGDILVGMDGDFNIRKWRNTDALLNQRILKVDTHDPDQLDLGFLFYWLHPFLKNLNDVTAATTVKHLSVNDLSKAKARIPGASLQKNIATILQTIDQAIEKTEALIEKYGLIKAGMMHDLFTRGLTPDGKLRPSHTEAPDLYQETPIGWIPKEWDWGTCDEYCSRISVGIVIRPTDHYVESGIPAFRSANIRENGLTADNLVYISEHSNKMLSKSQIRTNDILTVRTGYPGTSAVVPELFDGCNCVDVLITTVGSKICSEFLCYWINSPFGKGQVLRKQGGLAQQHFNVGELRELLTVLPGAKEQDDIVLRLSLIATKIDKEEQLLQKLELQKSGLMHDLLTGKVQVNVGEPAHD